MTKLPFDLVPPKTRLSDMSMLIHGFPKTGKTTLAAQAKDGKRVPLFIATEDGHHAIEGGVIAHNVSTWEGFLKLITFLQENIEAVRETYSCLAIDLLQDIDAMAAEHTCETLKIKALGDAANGAGWVTHRKNIAKALKDLLNILPCIFISHSKEKELHIEGEKIKLQAPDLSKACFEFVNAKVDFIGWIIPSNKTKGLPQITFRNNMTALAGTRCGVMATEFSLDPKDMKGSYKAMETYFKNKGGSSDASND